MSFSTVEAMHQNFTFKFVKLTDILCKLCERGDEEVYRINKIFTNLVDDYDLGSLESLNSYYKNEAGSSEKYYQSVICINVINKLEELMKLLFRYIDTTDLKSMYNKINNIDLSIPMTIEQYEYCCDAKMDITPESSEFRCKHCGKVYKIRGMVFEDSQFYSQEGHKSKHGKYHSIRHFHYWMERILAKEKNKLTSRNLSKIRRCIKRDNHTRETLSIDEIRKYLKELKLTMYNSNTSYILSIITEVFPPTFTSSEYSEFTIDFEKVMVVYQHVAVRVNIPYCPYFIYKIAESKFADCPDKLRILIYIHMQDPETVIKIDDIWKDICQYNDHELGYTYVGTDCSKSKYVV
jgi:hypothetical protein